MAQIDEQAPTQVDNTLVTQDGKAIARASQVRQSDGEDVEATLQDLKDRVELPEHNQAETRGLFSRAAALFWKVVREVPAPGATASSDRYVLTEVHTPGQSGDNRVAWLPPPSGTPSGGDPPGGDGTDQTARDAAAAAESQANANAEAIAQNDAELAELGRKTADLNIVSDGFGYTEAPTDEAGIAIFADSSTIGGGLIGGTRDLMAADIASYSWMSSVTLGSQGQAVIVRIEGTLGPVDYALQVGDTIRRVHDYHKVLSDETWDYFYLGSASDARITILKRTEETHTRFHGELAGQALEPVTAAREKADANETVIDRLSVFSHVHLDPAGIPGNDFPHFIAILLSNKIVNKTITRLRITLGGEQLLDAQQPQDLAALNLSGLGVVELSGAVLNGALNATARSNLKGNTPPATQYINCQLQFTFSDGTSATDRTSFGTNNAAFRAVVAPAAPTWVQALTAAAQTVNDANEHTLQTVRITPRSTGTRVLVRGAADDAFSTTNQNPQRDVGFELRLYRGATLLLSRARRNGKYASNEDLIESLSLDYLDHPNSTDEQTYTLRAVRLGGGVSHSFTDRQLIAHEAL